MIKIENDEVFGWDAALRGMRNPLDSWHKSDSYWTHIEDPETLETANYQHFMGDNDLKLAQSLSRAGKDHAKYLRMINVTCDLVAPLYWWKEFDTYKVGTVANSCSTMHTIHKRPFEYDDFSCEHLIDFSYQIVLKQTIDALNHYRGEYLRTQDKFNWWQMIQLLPQSYNQRRTVQLNYQVLQSMYFARRNHKLSEWHELCDWALELPHFKELCVDPMGGERP